MAGVKGRSGRKPSAPKAPIEIAGLDMLELLQDVALGRIEASPIQVRAAIAAVQYTHAKVGDGGKKESRETAAQTAIENNGNIAPRQAPKLVAVK